MGDMRIMLVDDNGDLRRGMRDYLARQEGMKVVAECPSGAEALEALGKVRVDVMVLDLIMPQMDGFALMEEVRRQQLANPPQIIVVSALGRDDFIMRAVQLGARFYMVKPFDMASLAARIRESCGQGVVPLGTALNASARSLSIDEKLASLFLTIGIPAHIKGYQFLRTAVKMVVDNPDMINRITKELYPSIGKCYNTSASKVERAIRHAIEVAWSRGRIDTLNKAFGCRVATKEDKPTNRCCVDRVLIRRDEVRIVLFKPMNSVYRFVFEERGFDRVNDPKVLKALALAISADMDHLRDNRCYSFSVRQDITAQGAKVYWYEYNILPYYKDTLTKAWYHQPEVEDGIIR